MDRNLKNKINRRRKKEESKEERKKMNKEFRKKGREIRKKKTFDNNSKPQIMTHRVWKTGYVVH